MNLSRHKMVSVAMLLVVAFAMVGCSSDKQVTGEIVGMTAMASFEDLTSGGELDPLVYSGQLIIQLPDGEKVYVAYPKELLVNVKGSPTFSKRSSGTNAGVEISVNEKQQALLVRDESDKWVVAEILEQGVTQPE